MKKTMLIGIAGGSASGKTSISAQLKEHYEDTNSVVIIRQDAPRITVSYSVRSMFNG